MRYVPSKNHRKRDIRMLYENLRETISNLRNFHATKILKDAIYIWYVRKKMSEILITYSKET